MKSKKHAKEEVFKTRPKIGPGKKLVLFLPLLLSLSWIIYFGYTQQTYVKYGYGGELLAPSGITPLMIALIIFTMGYILFLFLMFSENIQDFIWRWARH